MKKILFATTALVASAGLASAEVSISGSAEMGLFSVQGTTDASNADLQFHNDVDINFSLSGESDGGLSFGGSVDLDEALFLGITTFENEYSLFISGDFGTVTMGDTDGALDWAMQEASIGNPGSIRDDETSHAGFFGSYHDDAGAYDGQIVRYDHSLGGFSFAVSVEQNDSGSAGNGETDTAVFDGMAMLADTIDDNVGVNLALGLKYDLDLGGTTVGLGGGFQTLDANALILAGAIPTAGDAAADAVDETVNIFAISADVALDNGLVAALQFTSGDIGGVEDSTHIGVGVGYSVDNFSIHANYGQFSIGDTFVGGGEGAADNSPSGFGLAASYDLGGGLSAHFGYGSSDLDTGDDDTFSTYSIGFAMSF